MKVMLKMRTKIEKRPTKTITKGKPGCVGKSAKASSGNEAASAKPRAACTASVELEAAEAVEARGGETKAGAVMHPKHTAPTESEEAKRAMNNVH